MMCSSLTFVAHNDNVVISAVRDITMIDCRQIGQLATTKWLAKFPNYGLEQISLNANQKLTFLKLYIPSLLVNRQRSRAMIRTLMIP